MTEISSPDSPEQVLTPPPSADTAGLELLERLRGATLGEYDIHGELGRGGMATVYLAHEIALDRKVAIKVMSPALVYGSGMVERFKREARTAASLSHPNIIPIYAVREAEGLLCFVMKLVEGTPLDSIMRELQQLPLPMVEAILAQVAGAFGYAHRRGVVHRDIKPSNILIDDEGWAVVTDFGIAKVQASDGLTQTGTSVGTPTYMSPEQCGGGEITGASDQYSLGVVAYEMLTGRPPFEGSAMMALMYRHFNEEPPALEKFRPDCPEPMRAAVMRMLRKDPNSRFPTMDDAVAAMGARPLAHDDPTRSQLILLARSGVTHRVVSQVQTPRSPIPFARRSGELAQTTPTGAPTVLQLGPLQRILPWSVAAVALALLAVVAVRQGDQPVTPPPPLMQPAPVVQADPGPIAPPRPASPGGAPVTGSGTRPPAASNPVQPGSGGPVRAGTATPGETGPSAATPPAVPSQSAAAVSDPAVPPPMTAAPAATPAPAPPPAASTPAPAPSGPAAIPADPRAEISSLIQAYARALEASDLAAARRLYPGMPEDQRQGLEALWKSGGSMQPKWAVNDIVLSGESATARVVGVNVVSNPRGRSNELLVSLRARLERRGPVWRLIALSN